LTTEFLSGGREPSEGTTIDFAPSGFGWLAHFVRLKLAGPTTVTIRSIGTPFASQVETALASTLFALRSLAAT
jgi:hypothetical protein